MDKLNIYLIISLLLFIIGIVSFINSAFFEISQIEVIGNNLIADDLIIEQMDLAENVNIFYINYQRAVNRLIDLPQIKGVKIERILPNKIDVVINERRPLVIIKNQDETDIIIDRDREALGYYEDLKGKIPIMEIDNYSIENNKVVIKSNLSENFTFALQLLYNLDNEIVRNIEEVKFVEGVTLLMEGNSEARFGEDFSEEKKAEIFSKIISDIKEKNLDVEYIDLRYDKNSVVKER